MDIDDWRQKIDTVDNEILELLNKRIQHVIDIGKLKKQKNEKLYNPEREEKIFQRLLSLNKGPLEKENIEILFQKIIEISRKVESRYINNK